MKKKKSENNRKEKEIQIRPGPGQNKMSARTSCGGNHEPRRRLNRRNVASPSASTAQPSPLSSVTVGLWVMRRYSL